MTKHSGASFNAYPHIPGNLMLRAAMVGTVLLAGAAWHEHEQQQDIAEAQAVTADQQDELDKLQTQLSIQTDRAQRIAAAIGSDLAIEPGVITGEALADPSDLIGYGEGVNEHLREQLIRATVKILRRQKDPAGPWEEYCTGTAIIADGTTYISSAGHCFYDGIVSSGDGKGGIPGGGYGVNVASVSPFDYAIGDPFVPMAERDNAPIAYVSDTVVDIAGSDTALLRLDTSRLSQGFNTIYPIPAEQWGGFTMPGESVFLYSLPQAAAGGIATGSGVYLGRFYDPYSTRDLDIIGVSGPGDEPLDPAFDPCNFGASGSSAMMASGQMTGPLAIRNSSINTSEQNPGDNELIAFRDRLQYEGALLVDTTQYETLCGFAIQRDVTLEALIAGFDIPYIPPPVDPYYGDGK